MTVNNQFIETKRINTILESYKGVWAIAGGWAIDLFLGFETRDHKDIEIAIPRNEQQLLRTYLLHWECSFVENKELKHWKNGVILELPIHEIHAKKEKYIS